MSRNHVDDLEALNGYMQCAEPVIMARYWLERAVAAEAEVARLKQQVVNLLDRVGKQSHMITNLIEKQKTENEPRP